MTPDPPRPDPDGGESAPAGEVRELPVEVLRTARVALAGGPPAGEPGEPRATWIVVHGYRQLARRFLRTFREIATPERRVVAPEALSRFYLARGDRPHGRQDPVGASWMTREAREDEIRDYVRYLDRVDDLFGAGRRTVLGFSQGAHTAARWVGSGRAAAPRRLVLWGAALPPDLPDAAAGRLRAVEIVRVRGEEDPLRRPEEEAREEAWLAAHDLPSRVVTHPGDHRIDSGVLRELAGET